MQHKITNRKTPKLNTRLSAIANMIRPSLKSFRCKIADNIGPTLLVATLPFLAAHTYFRRANIYDEGFALTNAVRVQRGETPFVDFWTVYPPGTSDVLAFFFTILEPSMAVSRSVHILWTSLLVVFAYMLLRNVAEKLMASLASLLLAFWVLLIMPSSYSMVPAVALSLASIYFLIRGVSGDFTGHYLLAGVIGGGVVIFRHDVSAYLFLSSLTYFGLTLIRKQSALDTTAYRQSTVYLSAYLLAAMGVVILIAYRSGIALFLQEAIVFPALIQRDHRFLPFPAFLSLGGPSLDAARWLLAWLGPLTLCSIAFWFKFAGNRLSEASVGVICISWTMSLLLLPQAHGRLDHIHTTPHMIFLILAVSASLTATIGSALRVALPIVLSIVILIHSTTILSPYLSSRVISQCLLGPGCNVDWPDQTAALNFINQNFPSDEPVFVGNRRHDRIHTNDALLYFRLKRPIPTRWNEMHPGEATTKLAQEAMVRELNTNSVRVAVLVDMPSGLEKNASQESTKVFVLDTYLFRHFTPVWRQGRYTVMERVPKTKEQSLTVMPDNPLTTATTALGDS